MNKRLFLLGIVCLCTSAPVAAQAQQDSTLYQQAPKDWRAEVIPFPLSFAPDIKLEGVEELRFAPGMLEPESETFFTYTFVWWLEGEVKFTPEELEAHLLEYFTGLYAAVSKTDGNDVNFSVEIERTRPDTTESGTLHYQGNTVWIEPFVTEKELTLNMRLRHWYCDHDDHTAVFFAVSPKPYDHTNWPLMEGQKAGQCP